MFTCNFCKKEYSNISILNYHQKTAKFCKKLQQIDNPIDISENNKFNCDFCNKNFSTKFRLNTHLNSCKEKESHILKKEYSNEIEELKKEFNDEIEEIKKEHINELKEIKKDHANEIEELKKENQLLKKEHKKEIQIKDDYIQTLKNQLNIYIEKTTLASTNNNSSISTTNNNITNINIKNEEYFKLFELLKPMLPNNINESMRKINYQKMVDVVESLDEYFINEFVKNFKDYVFVTDKSRGTIVIKLENGDSSKVQSQQFVLDCFKIGEPELKQLFKSVKDYLFSIHEDEKMSDYEYALNNEKLEKLHYFVFNEKSNFFVNKIASELVRNSKLLNNKKSTDNKVLENELLKLMDASD